VIDMTTDLDAPISERVPVGGTAFEPFYEQQRRSLIALAYAVSGSTLGAEDLAQEALIAAYESWDEIRTKDNPATWVRRILLNKAASSHRRRVAELRALRKAPTDLDAVPFPEVTGEVELIWREVRRLPRRQTQVIALLYIEGLAPGEIAETLEISKESVSTHLRRARHKLARRLDMEENE
jgi:RNA polymerase sigma factor (sigma-70 family)